MSLVQAVVSAAFVPAAETWLGVTERPLLCLPERSLSGLCTRKSAWDRDSRSSPASPSTPSPDPSSSPSGLSAVLALAAAVLAAAVAVPAAARPVDLHPALVVARRR